MKALLRFVPRPGAAIDPRQDRLLEADELRIGRADQCQLRLPRSGVGFVHAILREQQGRLIMQAQPGATLQSNGQTCQDIVLDTPGMQLRIGPYLLTFAAATATQPPSLTIAPDAPDADQEPAAASWYARAFEVSLPNVRLMAFGLCCAIAALFFVLPLAFAPGQLGAGSAAASDRALAIGTQAATAPAHLSALWNVGMFSMVHAAFGDNCAHCHQSAFSHVPSAACLNCHRAIGQHADPRMAPRADLRGQRCEDCHHEHKGLVLATSGTQADCVACHANIHSWAPRSHEPDVQDFAGMHPQFSPALVQDARLRTTQPVVLGSPDRPDASGLRFTHAKHLGLDTLNQPGNAGCAQCHTPAAGGAGFRPVEFETSCARCHALQFEPRHPEWRLPHGHAEEVASRIAGYYASATLAHESFALPPNDLFARPGAPLPPPVQGAALVSNEVAAAMMSSIARSACGQCHEVRPPRPGAAETAWTVAPVFVPDRYLPRANFSHASHATTACATCHAARTSDGGPLALLPGIATCRLCHAGEAGAPLHLASTCVTCHAFHDPAQPLLQQTPFQPMHATPLARNDVQPTESK